MRPKSRISPAQAKRPRAIDLSESEPNPVRFVVSEPEPVLAILRPRSSAGKPLAKDVILLIVVADSSLDFDRDIKLPIYAENGVPEYWIVNLLDSCVDVYREPQPDGTYCNCRVA